MFLNKIKSNKNNFHVSHLVGLRLFLSTPFPELNEFPKPIDTFEKLYQFSIEKSEKFWSTVARSCIDFDKVTTGNTFKEILRNKHIQPLNIGNSNNDFFSSICNILLNLLKYLEDKSLHKIVKYLC